MVYEPKYKYVAPCGLVRVYDIALVLLGFGQKFRKKIINAVSVSNESIILDVGCGTGVLLELLKQQYPGIIATGIDPDKEALDIATKRLEQYQNTKLIHGFAEHLPFADNSFDVVYSTLAFHHMPTEIKEKAVQEIYRVLKSNGTFVLMDYGTTKHPWFYRLLTFWEPSLYIDANLKGMIPKFMQQAGFQNVTEDSVKFPVIHLVLGKKM